MSSPVLMFIGEKRSALAVQRGFTWQDGRLAAKTLFDALTAAGINPTSCIFLNWFEYGTHTAIRQHRGPRIAMGKKVQKAMRKSGIPFISMIHPAARGSIRRKDLYIEHVKICLKVANVNTVIVTMERP